MRWPSRWPPLILASCVAEAAVLASDAGGALALVTTLWFLLFCTGMAFVPLLPPHRPAAAVALGFAVSLAVDAAAATAMVVSGAFSPRAGLLALIGVCLIGCGCQIRRWPSGWAAVEIRVHHG